MKPETIKKLQKNVPELKELVLFLAQKANELNTLDGLEGLEITERAYEVTARLRAYEKLRDILAPLVDVQQELSTGNNAEYIV
jgi:hypothetical protein